MEDNDLEEYIVEAIDHDMVLDGYEKGFIPVDDDGKTGVIKASTCYNRDMPPDFFEYKVLKGILLSIKHGMANKVPLKLWSFARADTSQPAQKKAKSSGTYDRLAIFGDVSDPPNCFAILTQGHGETTRVLGKARDYPGVGTMYYIPEPQRVTAYIGDGDIPIINPRFHVLPLKSASSVHPLHQWLPPYEMTVPQEAGGQLWFAQHKIPIKLSVFGLETTNVSCTGIFCDRTRVQDLTGGCGCFYTKSARHPVVGQYTVTLPVPASVEDCLTLDIVACRSLRTTKLFFENVEEFQNTPVEQLPARLKPMRDKVSDMVSYVNSKGGWTVVGWIKMGEVADSSTPGEKIVSSVGKFHISLLLPTRFGIRSNDDLVFNDMKITTRIPSPFEDVPAPKSVTQDKR